MKRMMLAGVMVMLGGLSVRAGAQMDDPKFVPREEPVVEAPVEEVKAVPLTALLRVDDEFAYRAESVVRQRVTTPAGVALESVNESDAEFVFRVVAVTDAGAEVEMRYARLRVSVTGSGAAVGGMEFDSDESREDEEGNLLAMSLRPIVEGVMTVVLDAQMEVREVRGLAGLIPEGGKSLITEESIISTVTPVFALRGEPGEARVGEAWTSEGSEKQRSVVLKRTSTKKLERVSGGEATLSMTDETKVESGSMGGGMELEVWKTTGTAVWDAKERRLVSIRADAEQVFKGSQAGVPIRQSQTIESKMTRIPVEKGEDK
ncbi:MAG: hypothetical protein R3B46_11260 [Phycisphaerales bacterium]